MTTDTGREVEEFTIAIPDEKLEDPLIERL